MNHDDMSGMNHMDMRMYMIINWEYEVMFVFRSWKSTTIPQFLFGLFLTFLFMIFISTFPILKAKADKEKSMVLKLVWQSLQAFQASMSMIIMMTVNGWVLLIMALGVGVGTFLFYPLLPRQEKDEDEQNILLSK